MNLDPTISEPLIIYHRTRHLNFTNPKTGITSVFFHGALWRAGSARQRIYNRPPKDFTLKKCIKNPEPKRPPKISLAGNTFLWRTTLFSWRADLKSFGGHPKILGGCKQFARQHREKKTLINCYMIKLEGSTIISKNTKNLEIDRVQTAPQRPRGWRNFGKKVGKLASNWSILD